MLGQLGLSLLLLKDVKADGDHGVVSCNDASGKLPEMRIRLGKDLFEGTFAKELSEDFELVDDHYEKTISQEELTPEWDDNCKYTL